jgi:hypothetical protein
VDHVKSARSKQSLRLASHCDHIVNVFPTPVLQPGERETQRRLCTGIDLEDLDKLISTLQSVVPASGGNVQPRLGTVVAENAAPLGTNLESGERTGATHSCLNIL